MHYSNAKLLWFTVVQLRVQCTILTYFPILRLLSRHQLQQQKNNYGALNNKFSAKKQTVNRCYSSGLLELRIVLAILATSAFA